MITKETARRIYNCYQQIEKIENLKAEMLKEIERVRKEEEEETIPIPEENCFGIFGKGMQLGIPYNGSPSMTIFNISPELAIKVMDEQKEKLEKDLRELDSIVRIELSTTVEIENENNK